MTAQIISLHEQVAFVNFCESSFGDHATRDQIWGAMLTYLQGNDESQPQHGLQLQGNDERFFYEGGTHRWGGGNNIDREIVGEILNLNNTCL
jgi:hypothetical protein